jgi:hypothetical protein
MGETPSGVKFLFSLDFFLLKVGWMPTYVSILRIPQVI